MGKEHSMFIVKRCFGRKNKQHKHVGTSTDIIQRVQANTEVMTLHSAIKRQHSSPSMENANTNTYCDKMKSTDTNNNSKEARLQENCLNCANLLQERMCSNTGATSVRYTPAPELIHPNVAYSHKSYTMGNCKKRKPLGKLDIKELTQDHFRQHSVISHQSLGNQSTAQQNISSECSECSDTSSSHSSFSSDSSLSRQSTCLPSDPQRHEYENRTTKHPNTNYTYPESTQNEDNLITRNRHRGFKSTNNVKNSSSYYRKMTGYEAVQLLEDKPPGTFLVRDSSHPSHRYCISASTNAGVMHIRVSEEDGLFSLESKPESLRPTVEYDSMRDLLETLMCSSSFVDLQGCYGDGMGGMKLTKPVA